MNMYDYLYEQHEQDAILTGGGLGCFLTLPFRCY